MQTKRQTYVMLAGVAAMAAVASGVHTARAQSGTAVQMSTPDPTPPPVPDLATLPTYAPGLGDGDYIIAPPFKDAPELTPQDNVPKGKVYHFTMRSQDSHIYPGISKETPYQIVPYERRVTVYVPAQRQNGARLPFLVSQDSLGANIVPTILDNMIAARRLPAMAAIMIDSGGSDAQGSERGLEYDTLNGHYAEFIETEVVPRVEQETGITLTRDPDGRMAMGGSSGAACAFTMAWYHPDLYHRVLLYSGTFVNQQWPPNPDSLRGAWEYQTRFVPLAKRKPIRIWMQVGENDLRSHDPEETLHNWVLANQRMAGVLRAKKYHYQYVFSRQAGHVDGRVVRQTLPQALEYVWQGYPARVAAKQ